MKDRIAEFLRQQELSPSKLAELLGVQPSSISHLLSGRNKPGFDFIVKFLQRFPSVDPDWLLLGKGNIFRETPHPKSSTDSTSPNLFSSLEDSTPKKENEPTKEMTPEANMILSSKPKTESSNIDPSKSEVPENSKINQMIICFEDHTFTIYTPRK